MDVCFDHNLVLESMFLRGVANMIDILGQGYTEFLEENNLLETLIGRIKDQTSLTTEKLNSIEHLEQVIDVLVEEGTKIEPDAISQVPRDQV